MSNKDNVAKQTNVNVCYLTTRTDTEDIECDINPKLKIIQHIKLKQILNQYSDCFSHYPMGLGSIDVGDSGICKTNNSNENNNSRDSDIHIHKNKKRENK